MSTAKLARGPPATQVSTHGKVGKDSRRREVMTTERQEAIEYLTGFSHGIDRAEAEMMTRDIDLWSQSPEFLFTIEDEVEQWEAAHEFFSDLADMAVNSSGRTFNDAIAHVLFDADARTKEALRRAREAS
jgi:hypothetical protein